MEPPLPQSFRTPTYANVDVVANYVHTNINAFWEALSTLNGIMWALALVATIFIILSYLLILCTFLLANGNNNDIGDLKDDIDNITDTCCGEPIDGDELCDVSQTSLTLDCLSGVDINESSIAPNQVLITNENNTFINKPLTYEDLNQTLCDALEGANMTCLGDTNITDPMEGDIIRYNEISMLWENEVCDPCIDGTNGTDGKDGANATIDECDKPLGQLVFVNGSAPDTISPYILNISVADTWIPLDDVLCSTNTEEFVNTTELGCLFVIMKNDSYKITIDTSFTDNTPPDEVVWVGLSINGAEPLAENSFPSSTGHSHTMSFTITEYFLEGDILAVRFFSLNSTGLIDIVRLQFTIVGELLCGFDVTGPEGPKGDKGDTGNTGPPGAPGADGSDGINGTDGINCWDINENGVCDIPDEDLNDDGNCTVEDCGLSNGTVTLLRRALVNSTIPTNFRFNDPNGDPACTTSSSFITLSSFVYLGSDHDVLIERLLAIVSTTNTQATGEFQLTDLTNSNTIVSATSFGPTNDVLVILDINTISNLPTDPSILEVALRRSSMMGGGSACLHSIQVLG